MNVRRAVVLFGGVIAVILSGCEGTVGTDARLADPPMAADVVEMDRAPQPYVGAVAGVRVVGEFVAHIDPLGGDSWIEMLEPGQKAVPGFRDDLRQNRDTGPFENRRSGTLRFQQDDEFSGQTETDCEAWWEEMWDQEGPGFRFGYYPPSLREDFFQTLHSGGPGGAEVSGGNRFCTGFQVRNDTGAPIQDLWILIETFRIEGVRSYVSESPRIVPDLEPGTFRALDPFSPIGVFRYGTLDWDEDEEEGEVVNRQWYFYFGDTDVQAFTLTGRIVELVSEQCGTGADDNGDGLADSGCGTFSAGAPCRSDSDCGSDSCSGGLFRACADGDPDYDEAEGEGCIGDMYYRNGVCDGAPLGAFCNETEDCLGVAGCRDSVCVPTSPTCLEEGSDGQPCELSPDFCPDLSAGATCQAGVCMTPTQQCHEHEQVVAETPPSGRIGGGTGGGFRDCPEGSFLTRARASRSTSSYWNLFLTQFQLQCTPFTAVPTPGGEWTVEAGEPAWLPFTNGGHNPDGNFGQPNSHTTCPPGHAAVGIEGTTGDFLRSFRFHCAEVLVDDSGRLVPGSPALTSDLIDRGGNWNPIARFCQQSSFGTGAQVRSGFVVDSVDMTCGDARTDFVQNGPRAGGGATWAEASACPEGALPVGVRVARAHAWYNNSIARYQTICAALMFASSGTSVSVTLGQETVHPGTGSIGTWPHHQAPEDVRCPPGRAIRALNVGQAGEAGGPSTLPSGIELQCATPIAVGNMTYGFWLDYDTNTTSVAPWNVMSNARSLGCAPGMILASTLGLSGEVVHGIAARCRPSLLIAP